MTRYVWIAFVVSMSIATTVASAEPTKIALTIRGDSSKIGLRKAVVGAFDDGDGLAFVSAKKTARAIQPLGPAQVKTARDAKTVAKKLAVSTVVQGAFDKSAHKLKLTVYTDGKKGASFSISVADAASEKFRKAIRKKMLAKISVAPDDAETTAEAQTAPEPKADVAKTDDAKADDAKADDAKADDAKADDEKAEAHVAHDGAKKRHAKHVAAADDGDEPRSSDVDDAPSAHASLETTTMAASGRQHAAIWVDAGAAMLGRTVAFKTNGAEGTPSTYHAAAAAGAAVAAEVYPLAFGDRSRVIAGLGIGGELDQALAFKVQTPDGTMLPVTERHLSVGARFRIAFGHRPTSPTVTLGAGYAARTFAIRSTMPTGVPDVDYRMFEPSLVARVPVTARVTIVGGGSAMLMKSAGPIASADQYGRAHATGGTASLGLDIGLASHVGLRLTGEGTQVNLKFYGDGTMTGVQSARDRYYGGEATLAVWY